MLAGAEYEFVEPGQTLLFPVIVHDGNGFTVTVTVELELLHDATLGDMAT